MLRRCAGAALALLEETPAGFRARGGVLATGLLIGPPALLLLAPSWFLMAAATFVLR
jgi:hypothetical protein